MRFFCMSLIVAGLVLTGAVVPAAAVDLGAEQATVLARDVNNVPTFIEGDLGVLQGVNRRVAAMSYLNEFLPVHFGATGTERMVATAVLRDKLGTMHIRHRQMIDGLKVYGAELIVHARMGSGIVYAVNGRFVPDSGLDREAGIAAADALAAALGEMELAAYKVQDDSELAYVLGSDGRPYLAWRTLVSYMDGDDLQVDHVFADAATGAVVARHPTIHYAKSWRTYDGNNTSSLPGTLDCTNTGTCSDGVLQNIHNGASKVYNYYNAKFGRDSYTGSGATINSTGHHQTNYVNAFWNGSRLVYGDGDGSNSGPLGNAYDVVAHEFTHAVTSNESNLIYQNESGALNEGLSDIFAAGAESFDDGGVVSANTWLVGEDTWTPGTAGDALRYMANPTQDGSSRDYYPTRYTGTQDNGGVHWNSGIANLAFKLLVTGGSHPRGVTTTSVSGIGMSKAEQIFYRAQTTYLTSSSNYQAARNATVNAATDLYGSTSAEVTSVHDAWCAVGVPGCPGTGGGGSCPAGFTQYGGTISSGQSQVTSGGSASGSFNATLTGSAPDIDLYLQKESCSWWSCSWSDVASSTSASSTESISYSGSSGTYRWRVFGFSGSGITYTLCANPAL